MLKKKRPLFFRSLSEGISLPSPSRFEKKPHTFRSYFKRSSSKKEVALSDKRISLDFSMFCSFMFQLLSNEDVDSLIELLNTLVLNEEDTEYVVLWDYLYQVREIAYIQRNARLERALQNFEKTIKVENNNGRERVLNQLIEDDIIEEGSSRRWNLSRSKSDKSEFLELHRSRINTLYWI